jgi:hypothetical protein
MKTPLAAHLWSLVYVGKIALPIVSYFIQYLLWYQALEVGAWALGHVPLASVGGGATVLAIVVVTLVTLCCQC